MKPLANRSDVAMHPTAGPQSDRDRTVYLSTVQTTTHQKIVGIPSYGWLINSSSQLACSQLQNSHVLQVFNPFGKNQPNVHLLLQALLLHAPAYMGKPVKLSSREGLHPAITSCCIKSSHVSAVCVTSQYLNKLSHLSKNSDCNV